MRTGFALVALAGLLASVCAQTLDEAAIGALGNNSLFTRWRPRSRFIAPAGWMNDPCGAVCEAVLEL
jgi:beta-fructofuranosidase